MIAVTEYVKCEMCENNFCLNKIVSSKDGEYCKKCYEKIQLLLDKAREEGRREGSEITSRYIYNFVKEESGKSGRKEILEYIKELSKLKDNK